MLRMTIMAVLALSLSTGALQAEEETGVESDATAAEEVMVRVDISAIADELAEAAETDSDALPRSVELPIETAAEACDMPMDQLEVFRAADQDLECNAASLSPELMAAVQEQLEDSEQPEE